MIELKHTGKLKHQEEALITPRTNLLSPCLCGSGRKYKNCCWPVEKRTYAIARAAVVEAHQALIGYVYGNRPELRAVVMKEYFDGLEKKYGADTVDEFVDRSSNAVYINVTDSMVSDLRLDDGTSMVDSFLGETVDELHPSAVEFLKNLRDTAYSLYEITKVVPGSHFEVHDLLSRRNLEITDRSAIDTLEKWDVFFFRFVECNGENLMSGLCLEIPREHLDYVTARLETAKGGKSKTWAGFLKKHWNLGPELWAEIHGRPFRMPEMQNTDGEAMKTVTITCTIKPGSKQLVLKTLENIPQIEVEDENSFAWAEDRPEGKVNPVLIAAGSFTSHGEFTVSTNSLERCERVETALKEALSDYLVSTERKIEEIDLSQTIMSAGTGKPAGQNSSVEVPPDVVQKVYRKLYANWTEEPVPALGNLTPREAIKTADGRKRVINLLKSYEKKNATRDQKADLSFLWHELGLKRPD